MSLVQGLTDVITPVIEKAGFRLWDLSLTKAGKRSVVSVAIDKNGGVTLDDIASMSKEIAPVLDEHPSLDNAYHLEVSSPGLERPLNRVDHYEWSLGMNITASHRVDGTVTRHTGKLVVVSADDITIETEDGQSVFIPLDSITKAHTLFDFEEALKNGPLLSEPGGDNETQTANNEEIYS